MLIYQEQMCCITGRGRVNSTYFYLNILFKVEVVVKKRELDLDINISEIIEKYLKDNNILKAHVASAMNITRSGFGHKFKNPHWGTTLELIQLSIIVNHDFVSYLLKPLKDRGVEIQSDDFKNKYLECNEQREALKQQIRRSNVQIDMLLEERAKYNKTNNKSDS